MAKHADLALTDGTSFSIDSFIREVYARVPTTLSRQRIEATLDAFQATYDRPDLQGRLKLFSGDVVLEDPAGLVRATGKSELEAFFRSTFDNGVKIIRRRVERIIVGDQALERFNMQLEKAGLAPERLPHVALYELNGDGLIRRLRAYFDLDSIGRSVS
jgi:ketosteroid isomerase-like protein